MGPGVRSPSVPPFAFATLKVDESDLNPFKRVYKPALKIALILILSFIGVEILLIVLDPYFFKGRFEYDPEMGFKARAYYPNGAGSPGEELTNRFGFNAPDFPLQKPPGTFRILFVGDSFGWAGGLNRNYTHLLQEMFDSRGGRRVEIINTGYPRTHTGEQLIMLKNYGLQYQPDLVVLGFFAGNDFIEADPNRKRIIVNDCYVDIDRRHEHRLFGYPIIAKSRVYLLLQQKYEIYSMNKEARKEAEEWARSTGQPVPKANLSEDTFYSVQRTKLEFFNTRTSEDHFRPNIEHIRRSIAEMDTLLKSKNIRFMVAIYPDEEQVSAPQFDALVNRFQLSKEDYDLNRAQDLLKSFLDANHILYLDMLDRFRDEERQRDLYLWRNTHWNDAGNRLAAEMLFEYFNQHPDELNKSN